MNALEIKYKRKELRLTQEQLAKELGITKRTVINYEKGEVIPESKVKLLHSVLFKKDEKNASSNFKEILLKKRHGYGKPAARTTWNRL